MKTEEEISKRIYKYRTEIYEWENKGIKKHKKRNHYKEEISYFENKISELRWILR